MTKSVNPKNLALWTLGLLYLYLCEWAYSEYDTTEHPALGMCPQAAFTQGIINYGSRAHRLIPDDENWVLLAQRLRDAQGKEVFNIINSGQDQDKERFLEQLKFPEGADLLQEDNHLSAESPSENIPIQSTINLQLFDSY